MKITHGFGLRAHDLVALFDKTNKVSTFMNKLEKQSLIDTLRYDSNKYKGDGFEFLVEILLKSHAYDNRLGITNYQPIQKDDNGWAVYPSKGGKRLGTHPTKKAALKQLAAIEISKHKQ